MSASAETTPTQRTVSLPDADQPCSSSVDSTTPSSVLTLSPGPPVSSNSPEWKSRKRFAPVTFTPPLRSHRNRVRTMVYGYTFDRDYLDAYCARHSITPLNDSHEARLSSHLRAMMNIIYRARIGRNGVLRCVYSGGYHADGQAEIINFVSVASNRNAESIRGPGEEDIRRLQSVMGLTTRPTWYQLAA